LPAYYMKKSKYKPESVTSPAPLPDPVLRMWGLGKEIWQGVDADEYVRSLRVDCDAQDDRGEK